ncbi:MAG: hypothetical protein R2688_09180 [Fimbriimonadaceae bacterium]
MDAKFRGMARELLGHQSKPVLVGTRSIEMTEQVSAFPHPRSASKADLDRPRAGQNAQRKAGGDFKKEADALFNPAHSARNEH